MFVSTVDEVSNRTGDTTDSGWSLEGGKLVALDGESCFVTVSIPQSMRLLHPFSLDLMSLFDDRFTRNGFILQLTEWTLGSSEYDQVGWKAVDLMRRAFGEARSLEVAPVHIMRFDEALETRALMMQVLLNSWSAIFAAIPVNYFLDFDEDGVRVCVANRQIAATVFAALSRWNPH
jgi:hypothetical protein